jgi:hypothetical protein
MSTIGLAGDGLAGDGPAEEELAEEELAEEELAEEETTQDGPAAGPKSRASPKLKTPPPALSNQ